MASHKCLNGLGSEEIFGQVNALGSLSCSLSHSWIVIYCVQAGDKLYLCGEIPLMVISSIELDGRFKIIFMDARMQSSSVGYYIAIR